MFNIYIYKKKVYLLNRVLDRVIISPIAYCLLPCFIYYSQCLTAVRRANPGGTGTQSNSGASHWMSTPLTTKEKNHIDIMAIGNRQLIN